MKIVFASFQGIDKNGNLEGMVRVIYPILKYFDNYEYYIAYLPREISNIKHLGTLHIFLRKFLAIISKIFKLHYGITRFLQEFIYDIFLSFKIKNPVILISTAYIPKTAKKNKRLGGINIFIAGNPYERYINRILKNEMRLFNLKFKDAYVYTRRLNFIDNFLSYQDWIVTQTKITYESFKSSDVPFLKSKNISLSEIHIIPSKELFKNTNDVVKNSELTFVYLSHTVWLKGLIYLVQAWNKLDNYDNVKLVIGGSIHPAIKSLIKKYPNKNIEFIGPINKENLNEFYRKAHVCIVPSLIDNHPATISEALFCGLPVIVTEGCGSKTLVKDGENGFVVPIADANALFQRIIWFIENQDKIEQMSANAYKTIKSLENSEQYKVFSEHIKAVLEKLKSKEILK
jgi:glycosyltransferase involved in cell wall biosynthesis